jgi:high-affinity nickel-transport protein
MCLMDTTDGVLMSKAYTWALMNPLRRIFYNLTTTGLTVVVALLIGSIELLQVFIHIMRLRGALPDVIASLDMSALGYLIVGTFLLAWTVSVLIWKFGRLGQRDPASLSR